MAASPILSPENPLGTRVLLSLFRPESLWAASLRASKERGTGCWRHSGNCPLSAHHSFPPPCPVSLNPWMLGLGLPEPNTAGGGAVVSLSSYKESLHAWPREDDLACSRAQYRVSTVSLAHIPSSSSEQNSNQRLRCSFNQSQLDTALPQGPEPAGPPRCWAEGS